MNTKAARLKSELIYHPIPLTIRGAGMIARYIRLTFKVSYYLSRQAAAYVIQARREELEKLRRYKNETDN